MNLMKKKVILLGDSITQGLGSKKINFTKELQDLLGDDFEVVNMAQTGTTIYYAEKVLDNVISQLPRYVVILYGNVDAQIRPSRTGKVFNRIPSRFKKNGMLMPRPFYSHSKVKRWGQKIDNMLRRLFSTIIYHIDGTEQWVGISDFTVRYEKIIKTLISKGIYVITCSTVYIDDTMFYGSCEQYKQFNCEIQRIALRWGAKYIDLFSLFNNAVQRSSWNSIYCYDHFHPNEKGYQLIAQCIHEALCQ